MISANRRLLRCRVEIIPPSGRRVFGYCRVSTEHQVEDGISLEEQQRRLQGHAIAEDWNFTRIFVEEGISGVIPFGERPQGRQLLTMLRPGDTIVCTALDRFTRSAIDAQRMVRAFRDRQIALWLLDTGGNVTHGRIAKLLLDILAAIAQYQRRQIIARTSGARRYLREHGRFLGGRRPFGYQLDPGKGAVPLRPDPAEQAALEDIRKMRVEGASLRQIAAAMRGHGLELSHVSVKRLLDRADPVPPQLATAIDPDIAAQLEHVVARIAAERSALEHKTELALRQPEEGLPRYLGGRPPFGYRLDKGRGAVLLTPDKTEQQAIASMREMRLDGVSFAAISVVMRDRRFDLSPTEIKQLLRARVERLNNDDRLIIERGREALAQLHRHPSGRVKIRPTGDWNLWITLGHALLVCRAAATAEAGDHGSSRYAAAASHWLREEGFGALGRLTRTHLFDCMLHLAAIDQWRMSLPATSRNLLNHPTRTWGAWLRAGGRLSIAAEVVVKATTID